MFLPIELSSRGLKLVKHEIFSYKIDQTFFIFNMRRKKYRLKFTYMFMLWSSFFLHFLLLQMTVVCQFSHHFLIYIIIKILSPFSNVFFAYMTLQLCITGVFLTIIVQMSVPLLLWGAFTAFVWSLSELSRYLYEVHSWTSCGVYKIII